MGDKNRMNSFKQILSIIITDTYGNTHKSPLLLSPHKIVQYIKSVVFSYVKKW